jgi:hypothetical protein
LNPFTQEKAALEGIEDICNLVLQYRVIEKAYRSQSWPSTLASDTDLQNLRLSCENKLVKLYSSILEYEMSMACHYGGSSLSRYFQGATMSYDWKNMGASIISIDSTIKDDHSVLDRTHLD